MNAKHHFFSPSRITGLRTANAQQLAQTRTPRPAHRETARPADPAARHESDATVARGWWQPGVYCSAPALFLWLVARLPDDMLVHVFRGGASMPMVLNQLGDALFFCGWVISAILLWGQRRRS